MLFHMDSKTFLHTYLEREEDWRILDAYYVIISHRIRVSNKKKYGTIIYAPKFFYPTSSTIYARAGEWKEYKEAYYDQMKEAKPLLAQLIDGSLNNGYNIIFLYTPVDGRDKFPKILAQYIMDTFKYPIYEYKKYINEKCKICNFNPDEVHEIISPILKEQKAIYERSPEGKMEKREKIKKWSKKKLKKKLHEAGYYVEKESKEEMLSLYLSITIEGLPDID